MTKESEKVIEQINMLIDLNRTLNKDYQVVKLNEIKQAFYEALSSELNNQHETYVNLL